ncbi:MAG: SpoIIE family protein phosphatase [Leptospira sp.]|nr:SpoIIE family protein phosphatase [Leptospira sp.]
METYYKWKKSIYFVTFIFFLLPLYTETNPKNKISEGKLIIGSNIESSISLDGKWKFYWNKFRPEIQNDSNFIYLPVPSAWKGFPLNDGGEKIPAHGYGTYVIDVSIDKNIDISNLCIRFNDFGSSYEAYANGILIAKNGKVASNKENYQFDMKPIIAKFPPGIGNEILIEIEVANYDNTNGGFWNHAYLGKIDTLYIEKSFETSLNYFFIGITSIIGLYSILYYFYMKSFKSSFYFGLFSLLLGFRTALTGERIFSEWFPDLPFYITYKAEYLTMYLSLPCFAKYTSHLIPNKFPKYIVNAFIVVTLICSSIVLFFSASIYSHTLSIIHPLIILYGLIICYYLFKSIMDSSSNALLVLISLIFLLLATVNDILFHETIIKSMILVPYALILFILLHGILLGKKFASSYIKAKFLTNELVMANSNLEDKIRSRTKDLQSKILSISNDLNYAKSIQERILGEKSIIDDNFEFQAIYRPIEELGGDYFDVFEYTKNNYRIIVADATGHGVQAALVTMAIKSEYEYAKFKFKTPSEILGFLNLQFCKKYKNLKMYFTCVVLDFNSTTGDLNFSSAGHPDQVIIRSSNTIEELQSQGSIIGLSMNFSYANKQNIINSNETIYLFTDGWVEQYNRKKEMYGESRFHNSLLKHNFLNLSERLEKIEKDTDEFLDGMLIQDDLALIGITKK